MKPSDIDRRLLSAELRELCEITAELETTGRVVPEQIERRINWHFSRLMRAERRVEATP